jgi:hypothetical protein
VSLADRLHAARMALEGALALAQARSDEPLVVVLRLGLAASAESEAAIAKRASDAERQRRGRRRDIAATSHGRHGGVTGGVGGGVSSDLHNLSVDPQPSSDRSPQLSLEPVTSVQRRHGDVAATSTRRHADRGTRLAIDWQPSADTIAWAENFDEGVDALSAVDEFRDYWCAVVGPKALKLDWEGTFRNRIRELVRLGKAPMLPPRQLPRESHAPKGDPVQAAAAAQLIADLAKAKSAKNLEGNGQSGGT